MHRGTRQSDFMVRVTAIVQAVMPPNYTAGLDRSSKPASDLLRAESCVGILSHHLDEMGLGSMQPPKSGYSVGFS